MEQKYEIDKLDKAIIKELQQNARRPFTDIARKYEVSGGTIHQRVERLRELGIITGSKVTVDRKKLGYGVEVLLGIHLVNAKHMKKVLQKLENLPEVIQAKYTTGHFALFVTVVTADIDSFHQFLVKKLQVIEEIRSTESFVCLNTMIDRQVKL